MNDTSSFGGFINSFMTSFHDQYGKIPNLVIPLLSDASSHQLDFDDHLGIRKAINDALYLRSLDEFATMSIPVQSPNTWPSGALSQRLTAKVNNIYHHSAILSALVETSTLPLRLKRKRDDISSISAQLNWRGTTRFCELSGIFPVDSSENLEARLVNFSAARTKNGGAMHTQFTRQDVTRGFSPSNILTYEQWSSGQPLQDIFVFSTHAGAYPIPTSFPPFFKPLDTKSSHRRGVLTQPTECAVFSSLSTSSSTGSLFSSYTSTIETYLRRKPDTEALGFDRDDLKDLVGDLWTLHDKFIEPGSGDDGSLGEDEE